MMHVGLIVGIGPAATDYYYRTLITAMTGLGQDLELTMVHADTPTLLNNQEVGAIDEQVRIYERLTRRLQLAGAESVAVTSIAGHFCIEEFKLISPLPVIDLCEVVRDELHDRNLRRVGLLGTKTVMESQFYGALGDVVVLAPGPDLIDEVHLNYVAMAQSGVCSEAQRAFFFNAGQSMVTDENLDAVLLAGTDLVLAFNGEDPGFPIFDCAKAHAMKIAEAASNVGLGC
jgi:aspartate racemase